MMQKLRILQDKSEVMSILLSKANTYFVNLERILKYPLVLSSSGLVIINSYFNEQKEEIRIYNIICNSINIFFLALLNNMGITNKIENFKAKANEFLLLSHKIDANILKNEVNDNIIINYQEIYDTILINTLTESIPENIKKNVRNLYDGKKHLPLTLNGLTSPEPLKQVV